MPIISSYDSKSWSCTLLLYLLLFECSFFVSVLALEWSSKASCCCCHYSSILISVSISCWVTPCLCTFPGPELCCCSLLFSLICIYFFLGNSLSLYFLVLNSPAAIISLLLPPPSIQVSVSIYHPYLHILLAPLVTCIQLRFNCCCCHHLSI